MRPPRIARIARLVGIERGEIGCCSGAPGSSKISARDDAARPVDQSQDDARRDALAAAAFADDAERPPGMQVEADAVERAHEPVVLDEIDPRSRTDSAWRSDGSRAHSHRDRPHRAVHRRGN